MKRKKYKYPIYKQSRNNGCVVKFTGLKKGKVIKDTEASRNINQSVGHKSKIWVKHTNNMIWKDYEYKKKQMKDDLSVEIREKIKYYIASKSTEITEEEIEKAIFDKGYIANDITIIFDHAQNIWMAYGDIKDIKNFEIGRYLVTQKSKSTFEISYDMGYSTEKKVISSKDFETILSTIFI